MKVLAETIDFLVAETKTISIEGFPEALLRRDSFDFIGDWSDSPECLLSVMEQC